MKKKNTALKVSIAALALLMSTGYVANSYNVTLAYAQTTKSAEAKTLIDAKTNWNYLDNNVDPGTEQERTAWTKAGYALTNWKSATGTFGAKNGTIANLGGNYTPSVLLNQYINGVDGDDIPAFFFRTTINVDKVEDIASLTGSLVYDDAAIVYINGVKITSFDEPDGGFDSNMSYGGSNAGTPKTGEIDVTGDALKDLLKAGENVIAVELHQGRSSSSDVYFEFDNLQINYGETAVAVEQKAINLTVGSSEDEMNLTWYANDSAAGTVQIAKAGAMINGAFPQQFTTINATNNLSNDNGFYYNQATISKLEENTKYVYRLVNGKTTSEIYDFTTKDFDGSFNFVFAGDPQIGASGNADSDTTGWNQTLKDSVSEFNPNFILSAGDQVNTANSESQYSGYLNHSELTSVPQATTVGNHDSGSVAYQQHFNLPNETDKGATTAGSDYWYVYNNTLFMNINTNNTSTAEHQEFMQAAIEANSDVQWKVVVFHHSIYSVANHSVESSILSRREQLVPVFEKLGVDVVLMGHDHVYVRSNIMKEQQVVQDTSNLSSVTNPDGILYLTANSASGSKYYNIKTDISTDFVAKMDQSKQRSISNIEVSNNEFKIVTYLYDSDKNEWATIDTFSINKTAPTDKTTLQIVLEEANKITENKLNTLVPVVVTEFKAALAKAQSVYDNNASTQEEINSATDRLAKIMQYLDFKKGDKTSLEDLVAKIKALDSSKYSEASWQAMLPALQEANKVIDDENALEAEVTTAQQALVKAYLNLRLIPSKDALNELIKQIEGLNQTDYTTASWTYLQTTLANAKTVMADTNATESQIANVQEALTTAYNGLVKVNNSVTTPPTNPSTTVDKTTNAPTEKTTSGTKVTTGDNTDILAYGTLLFTALGCSLVALKAKKKN